MPSIDIVRSADIVRTPRVMQVEGMFDLQPSESSESRWSVNVDMPDEWNVGLIVGPSGSGKTTVARRLFAEEIVDAWDWDAAKSVIDSFPKSMSIRDITSLLSSVGFSSPPSWLRPFHALSNGEQFRVFIARTLAERPSLAVVDEFTSVVDRTVARIGSAAIQKTVRKRGQRFVAVSCHDDIAEWLEPDWIYEPSTDRFAARRSLRRPQIEIQVRRVHSSSWQLFRKHHYLNHDINKSARCYVAFWNDRPVAFGSFLHFVHSRVKNTKIEHRTVCLPDFQGVGIGNALSAWIGAMLKSEGLSFISRTSHPAMIASRCKSPIWSMTQKPSRTGKDKGKLKSMGKSRATNRKSVGFKYVGGPLS